MKKLFCLVLLICCLVPGFSSERISVFIDISGSMDSQLSDIKKYVTEEYIPSLKPDTELKIYKFYGKIRPPIYDGNLNSESKISWAKNQVNSLVANGPWTNIEAVLDYISANCIDYGDKFIILTDGKNEADEYSNAFEITDTVIKEKLGENASLISHGKWKTVEFTYAQKKINVDVTPPITVQNQETSDKPEKMLLHENSDKTISKGSFKFKLLLIPLPLILIILLIILFAKIGSSGLSSSSDMKFVNTNNVKLNIEKFSESNVSEIKCASIATSNDDGKTTKMKQRQDEIQKEIFEYAEKEGLTKDGNGAIADGISNIEGYNKCPHKVSIVNKEANEPGGGGYAMTEGWTKENLNSSTQKNTEVMGGVLQGKIEDPSNTSIEEHMNSSNYAIGDSNYVNTSKITAGNRTKTDELLEKGKKWAHIVKKQMENADSELIYCGGDGVLQNLEKTLQISKGESIYKGESSLIKGVYKIDGKIYIDACHPDFLRYQSKDVKMQFFKELANIRNGKY